MRIGIDARTLRDDYPGIGRYIHNLLQAMQPYLAGHTLVIIHDLGAGKTRYDLTALTGRPGVEFAPFSVAPRALSQQWKLPGLLGRLELDLFHSPYYVTAYWRLPCPLVLSLYDLIPILYPPSMPSLPGRLGFRLAVTLAAVEPEVLVPATEPLQ